MDIGQVGLLAFFGWMIYLAVRRYARGVQRKRKGPPAVAETTARSDPAPIARFAPRPEFRITYCDSAGDLTSREIKPDPRTASQHEFDAWCSLRQEPRTFRWSRLLSAIDLESGELLNPRELYERLQPDREVPLKVERWRAWRVCAALTTFARDLRGRLGEPQKRAICVAIREADADIDEPAMESLLRAYSDDADLRVQVKRLTRDERDICYRAARLIVQGSCRKHPDPEHLAYMDEVFG